MTTGLLDLVLKRWYREGSWKFDDVFDGVQAVFGVGEGTRFDNRIDAIFRVM